MPQTGPLSPFQEVYWHAERLAPGTSAAIVRAFDITGPLDVPALAASLRALVARHGALRTRFEATAGGEPVQVVQAAAATPLRVVRLAARPTAGGGSTEDSRVDAALAEPFDLGRAPLLRLTLLRRAPEEHTLLLAVHHIICDGWSLRLLLTELGDGYAAGGHTAGGYPAGGPAAPAGPPPASYLAFVAWQRGQSADRLADARAYLHRVLTPPPEPVALAPDGAVDSYQNARLPFRFGAGSADRLAEVGRLLRVTPFIALLAGFKVALWALSGQDDLAVGSLFAGRVRAEFETTVGLFANATVLRTSLAGDPTFRELAGRVRAVVLDASDHQCVPVELAAPPQRLRPAWSVWFNLLPAPTDELRLAGARVRPRAPEPATPVVKTAPVWEGDNLAVTAWITGGEVRGNVDYNRRLLDPAAVDRLVAMFDSVTRTGLADPATRLSRLRVLAVGKAHDFSDA